MEKITANHPLSYSADIVQQNIDTLKALFPTIVKEGKIDIEELKALLGEEVETGEEYYRFTWAGKSEARREANKPSTGTLRPNKADSKDWDTTQNIFIEGDNLEVLKLLQKSYANKIKMIYIDPPYNTGNDFVYKDDYRDNLGSYLSMTGQLDVEGKRMGTNSETDGRYHSNWLNMMYPRLKLARTLLKDDGILFISIDDNEVHNLKKLCDELFGEDNFLGEISRVTGTPTGLGTNGLVSELDYILVYSKTHRGTLSGLEFGDDDKEIYNQSDDKGAYLVRPLRKTGGEDKREDRPSMYFPTTAPDGSEVYPLGPGGYQSRWRCSVEKYKELESADLIEWKQVKDNNRLTWRPYLKFYLEGRTKQPSNLWQDMEGNKKASVDLKNLFGDKVFDFPKPVELLKKCINISSEKDAIILDFFAGSGTTAQAVIQLNSEDGGIRRFICVQLDAETDTNSIAYNRGYTKISDITKERIRRVGAKIKGNKDRLFNTNLDIGFRCFKLDSSNINAWDGNPDSLDTDLFNAQNNIKEGRTEEDVLFEILLKNSIDLTVPIEERQLSGKTVYNVGAGALFVCLADGIATEVAEGIAHWKQELNPTSCKVIFKDTGFTDVAKTNSMQILKRYGITDVNTI